MEVLLEAVERSLKSIDAADEKSGSEKLRRAIRKKSS
jgi:hypothetical protein